MDTADAPAATLLAAAAHTTRAIRTMTYGKQADQPTTTTVGTLLALTRTIDRLVAEIDARRRECETLTLTLRRIAELDVRASDRLIARNDWRTISAELREIADGALGQPGARGGVAAIAAH